MIFGGLSLANIACSAASVVALSGFTASQDSWFADTKAFVVTGVAPNQYKAHDPFARVILLLPGTSTSLTIEAIELTAAINTVGIWTSIDPSGSGLTYNQSATFTTAGIKQQQTVTLPVGTRYVELSEQAAITGISATSYTIVPVPLTVPRRMVGYGDSILVGNNAAPTQLGYLPLGIRHCGRFDAIIPYGVAGSSLYADSGNGVSIAAFAAAIVLRCQDGTTERVVYIQKVTNDFGLDLWSASSFGAMYGTLLDAIHAGDPTIKIVCQTCFHRGTETAQPIHGSTWADFNTAITTAVSTRTAFAKVIDASQAFTQAQITASGDGLHPTTALHAQIATWLREQFCQLQPTGAATSGGSCVLTDSAALPGPGVVMSGHIFAGYIPDAGLSSTGWIDQGPGAHNLTGTCTVLSAAVNGQNAAKFNGTSDVFSVAASIAAPATTNLWRYTVLKIDTYVANSPVVALGTLNQMSIIMHTSTPQLSQFGNGAFGNVNAGGASTSAYKLIRSKYTGSTSDSIQCGGAAAVTGTSCSNVVGNNIRMGNGNGSFGHVSIAEDWIFTADPGSSLDTYYSAKFGAAVLT